MSARDRLSAEQKLAFDTAETFLTEHRALKPYLSVEGGAGVGKTYLLAALANRFPSATLCSPFGKAASNLSRKTGIKASTVHGAIYQFKGHDDQGGLRFDNKIAEGEWHGKMVLLDEKGVCGQRMGADLISTGCRVIAFGDPYQLPPVNDIAYFNNRDILLTEIHRQALDSAIIRQAHNIRQHGRYEADGPDFRVSAHASATDILEADIILSWTNNTRRMLNTLKRAHLGYAGRPMLRGEPIMALRNDHQYAIMNGAIYTLLEDHVPGSGYIPLINDRGDEVTIPEAWIEDFEGPRPDTDDGPAHPFATAYAATVHKLIGSEADNVLLVDEYPKDRPDWRLWAYTGATRAAKKVLVKI